MAGGKPSLGLLIGVGKPKAGPGGDTMMDDEDPMMGEEDESGEVVAARAFMDAAKGDDPQALLDAFRGLLEWVDSDEGAEPEEDVDLASHESGPPEHIRKHGGPETHRRHHEEDAY